MPQQQRRAAAAYKDIEEIDPQKDIRVRIVGTVLSVDEDSFTLDDGTGSTEVFIDEEQEVEESQTVRIIGRVLPTPDSFEVQAEVIQDFSDIDKETYDRVKKVVNTSE